MALQTPTWPPFLKRPLRGRAARRDAEIFSILDSACLLKAALAAIACNRVSARGSSPDEDVRGKKDPAENARLILTLQTLVAYFCRFQHVLGPFRTAHERRLDLGCFPQR